MNKKSLTLAFSCLGAHLEQLQVHIATLNPNENITFLVLVQKHSEVQYGLKTVNNVSIVYLDSIGLSKSRNAAIEHACTDYIWFLDDDVFLTNENITDALNMLSIFLVSSC